MCLWRHFSVQFPNVFICVKCESTAFLTYKELHLLLPCSQRETV
uniref:Uncharacterized protein n=1 Tax=Anguilla anguilla TaxID=7936 RepID=A0A0E9XPQ5_ANGAN